MAPQNTNTNAPELKPEPKPQETQQAPQQQLTIKDKQKKVSDLLELYKGSIAAALPRFLTPERMIRVALTAMSKTPELMNCTQYSLMGAIMTCAQLGVLPDSILGEAYLIPFKKNKGKPNETTECQVIIGYRGLCSLAMRSGMVKSVQSRAVFQGDEFEYELGLNEILKHKPCGEKDPGKLTHFYAIIHLLNGGHLFNVMTLKEVEAIRNESKNYKYAKDKGSTIWGMYLEEMGNKTVLRRLMKYAPLSPEINRAVGLDEANDAGINQNLKVEILDDLATPEDMKDTVYADIQEDEDQGQEDKEEEQKNSTLSQAEKAVEDTLNLLQKKDSKK